jgi:sortase (surface protein transpeptidase)
MRRTLVVGLLLVVVPPVAWWLTQPPDTVGVDPTAVTAPADVRAVPPSGPPSRSDATFPPTREEVSPPPFEPEHEGEVPLRLVIPAIGVDHPVVEVGRHPDGAMEIPHDVHEIGWYGPLGIRPGDAGSAVLAGHVDSRAQGRGAFFGLRGIEVGDAIVVGTEDGEQHWVVSGRTRYPKTELPIETVFAVGGAPRLVLITCGGQFDAGRRSYTDNVVVYAEPLEDP